MKSVQGALLSAIELDRDSTVTLFRQLDRAMRKLILGGMVAAKQRLPSSRQLADDLGVSRITVKNVYEQLVSEGYVYSKSGSGTFVADNLDRSKRRSFNEPAKRKVPPKRTLSEQCKRISLSKASTRLAETRSFRPGIPALDAFPRKLWNKYWKDVNTNCDDISFGYGPTGGIDRLKQAIAAHLKDARSVNCDAEQIVITTGAQQAFVLIAFALINKEDVIWYEDPGHIAGRDVFHTMGAKICPVPIDEEGLDIDYAKVNYPKPGYSNPSLIFTTPSHQHPIGTTMSLVRRLQLLSYAHENKSWVIEDDYDSEFQYRGRPLPALQALDDQGSVLYVGTFSKSLFPAVRVGYVIVPHDLVEVFSAAQSLLGQGASILMQEVVARFIEDGRFADHIRKMRIIYQQRRDILMQELLTQCNDLMTPVPTDVGMHLVVWLKNGLGELEVHQALLEKGIEAIPLSIFSLKPQKRAGLVLGFSGTPPKKIPPLVGEMSECLRSLVSIQALKSGKSTPHEHRVNPMV
jgi:GntR family transcriptional regulator/MocR family aminotransferase